MLGSSNNHPQQSKEGFMSGHKLEVLARESIDAFNRSDWEAILAMFAPGYIYEETGTGRRLEGAEATLSALQEWKSAFPDAVGDVTRVVVDGDTTVTEIIWRGTHSGPLQTGSGELPASGRPIEVWASMWAQWHDGKMSAERHHLDVLTMMGQLGAV
jgi:steroid delta-isomerase-like uncharacterized protein